MTSSKKVSLTYGSDTLDLELPESFMEGDVIRPRAMPEMGPEEILAALRGALERPIESPRLKDAAAGKKVAVIVSDEFRAGLHESIIRVLCEEIVAGGPASTTILCATGTHPPAVYTPKVKGWVEAAAAATGLDVTFVAHDCDDPALVPVGKSPRGSEVAVEPAYLAADVRVYGHEAKHHYMNGYSLIDKQVIPGISARRTVEMNHIRSLPSESGPGRNPCHPDPARHANPMAQDAREIRNMVERLRLEDDGSVAPSDDVFTFALDMISDKASVYWAGAGDPDTICRMAAEQADEQAQFTVDKTRYVLISPGGPPASQAMYGVQNCFDMAMKGAVEKGGEVLVVAPCEGRPDLPEHVRGFATSEASLTLFWDNLVKFRDTPLEECHRIIHDTFQLYMWKTFRVLKNFKEDRLKIHVHSQLPADRLAEAGFVPVADPQAWIDERAARGDGKCRVIDNGNKMFVMGR